MNLRAAASKTKGDNYLSIKDSESLDNYIQNTLASLYPPFEATAATVLWQLFSIVEKYYHGDGLRCLIDFLVPAKRILQSIQQETCGSYTGLIFCHEGWPLCIHEKVVVQLASLRKVRLKPGDFYFQIVPVGKQSANLVLKCLSRNGHGLEELTIPETMYGYIFTTEFLENVNCEWGGSALYNCLLTTGPATYRTPWKNIVNPIFVPTAESILQKYSNNYLLERLVNKSPDAKAMTQTMESNSLHESSTSNDTCSTVIEVPFANTCGGSDDSGLCQGPQSQAETQCLETLAVDEKVDAVNARAHSDGCLQTSSVAEEVIQEPEKRLELTPEYSKVDTPPPPPMKGNGTKNIAFSTNLGSPRQKRQDSLYFETKRLFRKSYIEALQNPMNLGSSSEESIAEEDPSDHVMDSEQMDGNSKITEKMHQYCVQQGGPWTARPSKHENANEVVRFGENSQTSRRLPVSPLEGFMASSNRSQSLNKSCMSSQNKDCKPSMSSQGASSTNPLKTVNGNSERLEKRDSHIHEFIVTKSKKDEDPRDYGTDFQDCDPNMTTSPVLHWSEEELLSTNHGDPDHLLPSQLLQVNQELLQSGVISLCGNRDRAGRAIVQVSVKNGAWLIEHSRVNALTQLLLYFYNIPRKDIRALGLLVLVDIRKSQTVSVLFKALTALQTAVPHSIHSALILVDKESAFRPDKEVPFQCEVLTTLKALHRFIDCTQLTAEFDGMFPYNHNDWICFRRKLEPFITNCKEAVIFLQRSVSSLNSNLMPSTAQEVVDLMNKHKTMMKLVLEDELLVSLRLEGGTILARLRKEEFCNTDDYRDAMETITKLYNEVDEEVHRLVLLSNKCFQHLENLLATRSFEEGHDEIKRWFEKEKEKYLGSLDQEQLSSENMKRLHEEFLVFSEKAIQYTQKGLQLLKENSLMKSEEECQAFRRYLSNITIQTQKRRSELENMIKLYGFYEEAHKWMVHCNEYLKQLSPEAKYSQSVIQSLQSYHQEAAKISAENFQKVNEVITALGNKEVELKQWNILWLKCQQTRHHLEEELSKAIKGFSKGEANLNSKEFGVRSSYELGHVSGTQCNHSSSLCSSMEDNIWDSMMLHTFQDHSLQVNDDPFLSQEDTTQNILACSAITPSASQPLTPRLGRFQRTTCVSEDLDDISSCYSEPIQTFATRHRRHPLKKIIKKTQSFELTQHESNHSELHHHRYTGVYIRGLEVASSPAAENRNIQRSNIRSPLTSRNHSLVSPSVIYHTDDLEEKKRRGSKVNHIMDEMITTEREYVRSLGYIIDSYFPEMERDNLPQDLRGKRNIIFGNLEKLYDFHCHYFLKELERCTDFPLRVSHCFLRHEEQFGMYALYSKNKPQSDTLLISHGNTFFKNKQQELGDKMNLASYLLKPIQRMSKYALLLKDLIKECSAGQEQELSALCAAEEMVKFQLRHGNDLLAMDAIRGCDDSHSILPDPELIRVWSIANRNTEIYARKIDQTSIKPILLFYSFFYSHSLSAIGQTLFVQVNLKEQGPLRCQDEFLVCCGRKKYLRHVFLFEDLILFSKTKKIDGGYDIYMYKQSFKTAEIGMTENVGDSGLRFEIWFRRRRKSQDTYILQANSTETKSAWTDIIGKILWRQALRNRELRMQEMVSMGIGNKPFMDIKPSEAAISDRAIDYIMKGAESRTRASIAVSSFDHSTPFKRPHSTISNSSTSSSSSQSSSSILGSLNLHIYSTPSHSGLFGPPFYHWSYDVRTCIEEDELEQDIGSQPSMMTESSESSQCTSGESACGFGSSVQDEFSPLINKTFIDEGPKFPSERGSPALSEKNPRTKPSKEYSTTDDVIPST